MLSTYTATRYMVPLREGGSLPAILDTEDGGHFVVKFRGAGQGARALIAEIIVGELARAAGLPVPELALVHLDESFGRSERDPEIQDLLKASHGLNVGMRYLSGAFNYDPVALPEIDPALASAVVWLDAFTTNIDRTPRNTNMMVWEKELWLIDHGAALYFHHTWPSVDEERARAPFKQIKDHVLLPLAADIRGADERMIGSIDEETIRAVLASVPDDLLMDAPSGMVPSFQSAEENREAYLRYFLPRLRGPREFVEEAIRAHDLALKEQSVALKYRR